MGCIEQMKHEILLSRVTFKECSRYVQSTFKEVYTIQPGYKIFDVFIVGVPPIYAGVEGDNIIFPYTKPCHGTFLLKVPGLEEIVKLRKSGKKVK